MCFVHIKDPNLKRIYEIYTYVTSRPSCKVGCVSPKINEPNNTKLRIDVILHCWTLLYVYNLNLKKYLNVIIYVYTYIAISYVIVSLAI